MTKALDPDWPVFEITEEDDLYELMHEQSPKFGDEYEMVTQVLADTDFYQGLNMTTVIRRKSDGKLFGYQWWDDISKHGEAFIEPNGGEFGLECDTDVEGFDWDTDYVSYFVFQPVEEWTYTGYQIID